MPRKKYKSPGVKKRKNGDGSIVPVKRKDGTLCFRVRKIVDTKYVNGEEKYVIKQRTYNTEDEAKNGLSELQAEYNWEKKKKTRKSLTVKEVFDLWIADKEKEEKSDSLINNYKWAYSLIPQLHDREIGSIEYTEWQDTIKQIHLGTASLVNLRSMIYQIVEYAFVNKWLGWDEDTKTQRQSPFHGAKLKIYVPKAIRKKPRKSLNSAEVHKLYDLAKSGDADAQDIIMLISCGWRPNEALTLRVENVDLERGYIVGGFKTPAGTDRVVPIPEELFDYFEKQIDGRTEGWLWLPLGKGKRYSDRRKLRAWRDSHFYPTLQRAGIDNPMVGVGTRQYHKYTPHSMRHTYATLMKNVKESDVDKMSIIGHASVRQLEEYQDRGDMNAKQRIQKGVFEQIKTEKKESSGVAEFMRPTSIPPMLNTSKLPEGVRDKVTASSVAIDSKGNVTEEYQFSGDVHVEDFHIQTDFKPVKFLDLLDRMEAREPGIASGEDDGAPLDPELYEALVGDDDDDDEIAYGEDDENEK